MGCGGSKDAAAGSAMKDAARAQDPVFKQLTSAIGNIEKLNAKFEADKELSDKLESTFDACDFPKNFVELEKYCKKVHSKPYMSVQKLEKTCDKIVHEIQKEALEACGFTSELNTNDWESGDTEECCKKLNDFPSKPADDDEEAETAWTTAVRELVTAELTAMISLISYCKVQFAKSHFRPTEVDGALKSAVEGLEKAAEGKPAAAEGEDAAAAEDDAAAKGEDAAAAEDDAAAEAEEGAAAEEDVTLAMMKDLAEKVNHMLKKSDHKVKEDELKGAIELLNQLKTAKGDKDEMFVADVGPGLFQDQDAVDASKWDTDELVVGSAIGLHRMLMNTRYTWGDDEEEEEDGRETLGSTVGKAKAKYNAAVDNLCNWVQEVKGGGGGMSLLAQNINDGVLPPLQACDFTDSEQQILKCIQVFCDDQKLGGTFGLKIDAPPPEGTAVNFDGQGQVASQQDAESWLNSMKALLHLVQMNKGLYSSDWTELAQDGSRGDLVTQERRVDGQEAHAGRQIEITRDADAPGGWFKGNSNNNDNNPGGSWLNNSNNNSSGASAAPWFKGNNNNSDNNSSGASAAPWFKGNNNNNQDSLVTQSRVDDSDVHASRAVDVQRNNNNNRFRAAVKATWFGAVAKNLAASLGANTPPEIHSVKQELAVLSDESAPEQQRVEACVRAEAALESLAQKQQLGVVQDDGVPAEEVAPCFGPSADPASSTNSLRVQLNRVKDTGPSWFKGGQQQQQRPGSIQTEFAGAGDAGFLKTRKSWDGRSKEDFDHACNVKFEKMAGGKAELDLQSFKQAFGVGSGNAAADLLTESLFNAMDKSHSGSITLAEYQAVMDMYMNGDRDDKANFVWDVYQKNNRVDQDRLKQVTMGCIELVDDSCLSPGLRSLKSSTAQQHDGTFDRSLQKIFGGSDQISKDSFVQLCRGSTIDLSDVHIHTNPAAALSPMPAPSPAGNNTDWFQSSPPQRQQQAAAPWFGGTPQPVPAAVTTQAVPASVPSMGPPVVANQQQQQQHPASNPAANFSMQDVLRNKFNEMDVDRSGFLEVPELRSVAQWVWSMSNAGEKPSKDQADRQLDKLSIRAQRRGGKMNFPQFEHFVKLSAEIGRCNEPQFRESIQSQLSQALSALERLVQMGPPAAVKTAFTSLGGSLYNLSTGIKVPSPHSNAADAERAVEQINFLMNTQKYKSDNLQDEVFDDSYLHILQQMQSFDWIWTATNSVDKLYDPLYKLCVISLNMCDECSAPAPPPIQDWLSQPQYQQAPQQHQNKLLGHFNTSQPQPSPQTQTQPYVQSPSPQQQQTHTQPFVQSPSPQQQTQTQPFMQSPQQPQHQTQTKPFMQSPSMSPPGIRQESAPLQAFGTTSVSSFGDDDDLEVETC